MGNGTRRVLLFAAMLSWCAVLIVFRAIHTHTPLQRYLFWNLFLASIPAIAAAMLAWSSRHASPAIVKAIWLGIWIVFLPNAPYIATDFVHLDAGGPAPLWLDIAVLMSCAATGLLLGYTSVANVQTLVTRTSGRAAGWLVASLSLVLAAFGIYLGRFLRWNSWDALARPHEIATHVAHGATDPLSHLRGIGFTAIYGVALVLGYIGLKVFASTFARRDPARPRDDGV